MADLDFMTADSLLYSLLKDFARENRNNPTEAERVLWMFLKGSHLGIPFKRQHVIGQYIADFVSLPAKLIIELDGGYHQLPQQQVNDEERQIWLESQGFTVLRFTNEEVFGDIDNVLETIEKEIEQDGNNE